MKIVDIRNTIPKHPTRKWKKRKTPAFRIIVHQTGGDNQNPVNTAIYHITPTNPKKGHKNHISAKGCPSICYADFIDKKGLVYHCNNYEDITWHAGLYNKSSIGVVMAYAGSGPTKEQNESLEQLLTLQCLYMNILPKNIMGHREVPGMFTILGNGSRKFKKSCPGMAVNLDKLRKNITFRVQRRLKSEGLYDGEIDGIFGKNSQKALQGFLPLMRIKKELPVG